MGFFLFSFPPAGKKRKRRALGTIPPVGQERSEERGFFSFLSPFEWRKGKIKDGKRKRKSKQKKEQFSVSLLLLPGTVGKVPPAHSDASVSLPHVFVRDKKKLYNEAHARETCVCVKEHFLPRPPVVLEIKDSREVAKVER